jgi:hypothetical protein
MWFFGKRLIHDNLLEQNMELNTYFVMQGEEVRGPYTIDFIEGLILSGLVPPDVQVFLEGGSEWIDIRNVQAPPPGEVGIKRNRSPSTPPGLPMQASQRTGEHSREDLEAEIDRRRKVKAIEENLAQQIAQIQADQAENSRAINSLSATPFGMKMLVALNTFNASRTPGAPIASASKTLRLASDISPLSDPNAVIQPHTASYIPVAHALEQLNQVDKSFASAFLKAVSERELNEAEKAVLVDYRKGGIALVEEDVGIGIVPTRDGLEYIKRLVPSSEQIGMLTARKNPIITSTPKKAGGFFGLFKS